MDIQTTFPVRYYINLARRSDRRAETEWQFQKAGIQVTRFPAVDARFVTRMSLERAKLEKEPLPSTVRGYENAGRYALALTQRAAIRRAKLLKADSVLLFEDDIVFHPNFAALAQMLDLPEDWGIFYFGCTHLNSEIEPVSPGIVRTYEAVDTHAFAVKDRYFDRVIRALDAHGKQTPDHPLASDRFLAALHSEIPTYACYPNLAWQSASNSDLMGKHYSNYHEGGTQKGDAVRMRRSFTSIFGSQPLADKFQKAGSSKLGLLFLTKGDVNHPQIWREFVEELPGRTEIHSHSKEADLSNGFLSGTQIAERYHTDWGDISLVRASLALLRKALKNEDLTHFALLSESCVPIKPLPAILRHLDFNPRPRFEFWKFSRANDAQKLRISKVPEIPFDCWRFHPQWWLLDRISAEWITQADYTELFEEMFAPDEAYFGTVLSFLGYPIDDLVVDKPATWTKWIDGNSSPITHGILDSIDIEALVESEAFFARKFEKGSSIGDLGLHRSRGMVHALQ